MKGEGGGGGGGRPCGWLVMMMRRATLSLDVVYHLLEEVVLSMKGVDDVDVRVCPSFSLVMT